MKFLWDRHLGLVHLAPRSHPFNDVLAAWCDVLVDIIILCDTLLLLNVGVRLGTGKVLSFECV